MIENDFSRVQRYKSGELWSTIQKVKQVSLDATKSTFRETTFHTLGVLAPQIYTHARDSPRHITNGSGVRPPPKKKFQGEHLKFGLKFSVLTAITLGWWA